MRVSPGESDQVKGFIFAQIVQRALDGLLRHVEWISPHGAGRIEHKNKLARHQRFFRRPVRRLQNKREVAAGLVRVRQHRVINAHAGDFVFKDEILVRQQLHPWPA